MCQQHGNQFHQRFMSNIKNTPIPVRNTLATLWLQRLCKDNQSIRATGCKQNDADEAVPAAKIVNPEVLNEIGQQKVTVQLTYETYW